jgi:hypothetical protein
LFVSSAKGRGCGRGDLPSLAVALTTCFFVCLCVCSSQVRVQLLQLCGITLRSCVDVQVAHTLLAASSACRQLALGGACSGAAPAGADPALAASPSAGLNGAAGGGIRAVDFVHVSPNSHQGIAISARTREGGSAGSVREGFCTLKECRKGPGVGG